MASKRIFFLPRPLQHVEQMGDQNSHCWRPLSQRNAMGRCRQGRTHRELDFSPLPPLCSLPLRKENDGSDQLSVLTVVYRADVHPPRKLCLIHILDGPDVSLSTLFIGTPSKIVHHHQAAQFQACGKSDVPLPPLGPLSGLPLRGRCSSSKDIRYIQI